MWIHLTSLSLAATLNVPADFPTLQEADDNASPGDVIAVAPGTYCEDVDFQTDELTIRGSGVDVTILDGACGAGTAAYGLGTNVEGFVLEDVTIDGAGIYQCFSASSSTDAEFRRVTFRNGSDINGANGAGLRVNANAQVGCYDCRFEFNTAATGAAVWVSGDFTAVNSQFCRNSATTGGAIAVRAGGSVDVETSVFTGNSATTAGGAVHAVDQADLVNNTFFANAGNGAAVFATGEAELINNIVAYHTGGEALTDTGAGGDLSGTHNLFWGNSSNGEALTSPVFGDPLFDVFYAYDCEQDFRMRDGSAAIGAGSITGVYNDIGAFPYLDGDGDGDGYTSDDCDDTNPDVNPGATEVCNGIDDDCDGQTDDDDPSVTGLPGWYADGDDDGYGAPGPQVLSCAQPPLTAANDSDCDDTKAGVNPDASEVCNGADDDCDTLVDDNDPSVTGLGTWYRDDDADAYGDGEVMACVQPANTSDADGDCDDANPSVNPGAAEICNSDVDDDCDGLSDDNDPSTVGQATWYSDDDGDGYGVTAVASCEAPDGTASLPGDCNDSDPAIHPGAAEVCNGIDDDCDTLVDDEDSDTVVFSTRYEDSDGDGYGDPTTGAEQCTGVIEDGDCNDADDQVNPGAEEACDLVDNDCDGLIDDDDDDTVGQTLLYRDADGDTFGDPTDTELSCSAISGYVAIDGDCDDTLNYVAPGLPELCNKVDDDCDGAIDEDAQPVSWWPDLDADGFGDANGVPVQSCTVVPFASTNPDDCDDTTAAKSPAAVEVCDGEDQDCDGEIDEDVAETELYFVDGDGDGFGAGDAIARACEAPANHSFTSGDCDDSASSTFPGADEVCDNLDNDCDQQVDDNAIDAIAVYEDADGDQFGGEVTSFTCEPLPDDLTEGGDCNDSDGDVNPGATDVCEDGLDQDCDGYDPRCDTDPTTPTTPSTSTPPTGTDPTPTTEPSNDEGLSKACGCQSQTPTGWLAAFLVLPWLRRRP